MDGQPTWTGCDEAGDYVVPNVLSPRDLVFRPDNMDETVPHTHFLNTKFQCDCTARFVWDLVGSPEDRFSHNEANFISLHWRPLFTSGQGSYDIHHANMLMQIRPPQTPLSYSRTGVQGCTLFFLFFL